MFIYSLLACVYKLACRKWNTHALGRSSSWTVSKTISRGHCCAVWSWWTPEHSVQRDHISLQCRSQSFLKLSDCLLYVMLVYSTVCTPPCTFCTCTYFLYLHLLSVFAPVHLCTSLHLWTLFFCIYGLCYYYCCCTVCTALLFSYLAIFIAASVRNKLIHSYMSEVDRLQHCGCEASAVQWVDKMLIFFQLKFVKWTSPFCNVMQKQQLDYDFGHSDSVWKLLSLQHVCTVCVVTECLVASWHRLRSANRLRLIVPRCRLNTYGRRAFPVAGPTLWDSLPDELRDPACDVDSFKQFFKTILFSSY